MSSPSDSPGTRALASRRHSVPWAERTMRRIGERVAMRLLRFIEAPLGGLPGWDGGETAPPASHEVNPFIAARHEFMNAFGDLAQGKRNWQVIAYALAGLLALVTIAYVRLAQSARVVPYVVAVDRLGQGAAVGPVDALKRPDERVVGSQ